ncbi:MAG: NAD(P)/FAD-dependent oxidoreductase [Saprospiraceae bacterium]|nr:NAD(P)/FAD-dependent oxidoreductase [Saprospiraceae bacterium]
MMKADYDVVVVGSGPGGATTAKFASEAGLRVLLLDKRQELGAPVQCSGAVSRHALLENEVLISDEFIQEAIYGFSIYHSSGENIQTDYRLLKPEEYGNAEGRVPLGYVVDRRRFDRYLMTQAERHGVEVLLKAEALDMQIESGLAILKVRHFNEELNIRCSVVVAADGLQSQVGKWAGLQTHIKFTELASCLQFVTDGVEADGLLEIITGHKWAPGGYAWVFPKGHGYTEIGLGVICSMTPHNAQQHLDQFLKNSFMKERFKNAKILEVQGGGVPLSHPLRTQYANNLILVGDAARQVNPITGGGIHTALTAGRIAGKFLAQHLQNSSDFSAQSMSQYQDLWMAVNGKKMWELYEIKSSIFRMDNIEERDQALYKTMSEYFSPNSPFKKI